jgi:hypothetical protein
MPLHGQSEFLCKTCLLCIPLSSRPAAAGLPHCACVCVCVCVPAVWEVFAAAHPWKGMTMGEVMSAVMIEGKRLVWGPGVPKVGAAV